MGVPMTSRMELRLRRLCWMLLTATALSGCGREQAAPAPTKPAVATAAAIIEPPAEVDVAPGKIVLRVPEILPTQVAGTLKSAAAKLASGLPEQGGSPGPGALELYLAVQKLEPDNPEANQGISRSLEMMIARDLESLPSGNLALARRTEKIIEQHQPGLPMLKPLRKGMAAAQRARKQVAQAQALAKAGKLLEPKANNAVKKYREALVSVDGYLPATTGLQLLQDGRLRRAHAAVARDDFSAAERFLAEAQRVVPDSPQVTEALERFLQKRQERSDGQLTLGHAAMDKLAFDQATAHLTQAIALWPQVPGLDALRERIDLARNYGAFKPAQSFSEILASGGIGPEMIVVPRGVFNMGSADDAQAAQENEKPQRQVRFSRGFAISRSEITVADFRRFIAASGYKTLATRTRRSTVYDERGGNLVEHRGVDWSRDHAGARAIDNQPVLHVAFEDAMAYADWLSKQTGQRYRLPSEAEWEYALRAGRRGQHPWGEGSPARLHGNLTGDGDVSPRLRRRWGNALTNYRDGYWGPAPARSFAAEGFGTYDMIGNVAEWTLDCFHDSYRRAPEDGSAWVNPGCEERVVRGASWSSAPGNARSAYRAPAKADTRNARLGIRLVREI